MANDKENSCNKRPAIEMMPSNSTTSCDGSNIDDEEMYTTCSEDLHDANTDDEEASSSSSNASDDNHESYGSEDFNHHDKAIIGSGGNNNYKGDDLGYNNSEDKRWTSCTTNISEDKINRKETPISKESNNTRGNKKSSKSKSKPLSLTQRMASLQQQRQSLSPLPPSSLQPASTYYFSPASSRISSPSSSQSSSSYSTSSTTSSSNIRYKYNDNDNSVSGVAVTSSQERSTQHLEVQIHPTASTEMIQSSHPAINTTISNPSSSSLVVMQNSSNDTNISVPRHHNSSSPLFHNDADEDPYHRHSPSPLSTTQEDHDVNDEKSSQYRQQQQNRLDKWDNNTNNYDDRRTIPIKGLFNKIDKNNNRDNTTTTMTMPQRIKNGVQSYQTFVRNHHFQLKLLEDFISKFILYAPFRFVSGGTTPTTTTTIRNMDNSDSNTNENMGDGMNYNEDQDNETDIDIDIDGGSAVPEMWYALLNLWSFVNDSMYYGMDCCQKNNGLTINQTNNENHEGPRVKNLGSSSSSSSKSFSGATMIWLMRTGLSIVECIEPALEVRAYYQNTTPTISSSRKNNNLHETKRERIKRHDSAANIHSNHTSSNIEQQHLNRHTNAMQIMTKVERIKFFCRSGIVAINYWKVHQTQQQQQQRKEVAMKSSNSSSSSNKAKYTVAGILQDGGSLHPSEEENRCTTESEQLRLRKLLYVGKRTGRRVRMGLYNNKEDEEQCNKRKTSDKLRKMSNTAKSKLQGIHESPTTKLIYLTIGEMLHLYRPLYWAESQCHASEMRHFDHHGSSHVSNIRAEDNRRRHNKIMLVRSWIISLAMDVISHKFTTMGMNRTISGGKSDSNNVSINVSSEETKEEIRRRKMRWMLYLLRAPVWDLFTYPIAEKASHIFGYLVPLVGRPVAAYVLELLMYWQRWHFMLESS